MFDPATAKLFDSDSFLASKAKTLSEIQSDPDYINAIAATKKAIFDKYSARDPSYTSANDATKAAIRKKFGVDAFVVKPWERYQVVESGWRSAPLPKKSSEELSELKELRTKFDVAIAKVLTPASN